jgi:hypothetical protein
MTQPVRRAWVASFRDGPLAHDDGARTFAGGAIFNEIVFGRASYAGEWVLVGWDSLPVDLPPPDQVRYRLVDVAATDVIRRGTVAYYEQVTP